MNRESLGLSFYLSVLARWWWLVLVGLAAGSGAAFGISTQIVPRYEATAVMLVVQQQTPGVVQLNDLQTSANLANTFARLIVLRPVMERAIETGDLRLSPEELQDRVSVTNPPSTQLLQLTARASAPESAANLANLIAESFISGGQSTELRSRAGNVTVVAPAVAPEEPTSPRVALNTILGGLLGLLLVAGVVALFEYLDDTVKSPDDVTRVSGISTLGLVEQFGRAKVATEQLVAAHRPNSSLAEEYRSVRTHLSYAVELANRGRLMLITSPGAGEGKTTTVGNLAVVFGFAGHKVLVVDGDLRRPTVHRVFGAPNGNGLSTALLSPLSIEDALMQSTQATAYPGVSLITSGPVPPNPSELLGSGRMASLLEAARGRYDVVLVDTPPVLVVTDAMAMAFVCDASILVMRAGHTRNGSLRDAVSALAQSGKPIAGAVVNRVRRRDRRYRYKGYEYYGRRRYERQESGSSGSAEFDTAVRLSPALNGNAEEGAVELSREGVRADAG